MDTLDFGLLDGIRWNPRIGRYQRKDGKLIARDVVLGLTRNNIAVQKEELVALADRLDLGELSIEQFQQECATIVKRIHTQSAILGKGGIDQMQPEDWLIVARELKRQYYSGKDSVTGQRFGLKYLVEAIQQKTVSLPQLKNSLTMFAASAKVTYFRMNAIASKLTGKPYGIRVLGKSNNCPDCIRYAAMLPQSIDNVVLPTQSCRCYTNCGCKIIALTLEEAIAKGMKV
jgi:hypothetical protein